MKSGPFAAALIAAVGILTAKDGAWAWWPDGHGYISRAAVKALPADFPAFFREGGETVAHCSYDPDVDKMRELVNLDDRETPEHFIDYEMLAGRPLPPTRYEFIKLCAEAKLNPKTVGLVLYAIAEGTERLAVAFAEHRRWPDDPHIRIKCLVYAGLMSHYAEDLCMPLHVTVDYDGRCGPNFTSPHSGIHAKVDALPEKLRMPPDDLARGLKVAALPDLMPGILRQIDASRALIDRVYALQSALTPAQDRAEPTGEVLAFTIERARESARFTASLYLTAWERSKSVKLPPWLDRAPARH